MVFTTNQTKHFFVATDLKENLKDGNYGAGSIELKFTKDKKAFYFNYITPGGIVRTDLIPVASVEYAKYTSASEMQTHLKSKMITLDSTINEGKPIVGQDYIININFRNYFGPSDLHTYLKQGVARAFNEDASELYARLAISLARNFAREIEKPLEIKLAGSNVVVTPTTKLEDVKSGNTGVVLTEIEQPWTLGVQESTPVNFELTFVPITDEGVERIWGIVEDVESGKIVENGKKIADMEYFYMKERGDQYGNVGWPQVVPVKYLANPNSKYDVLDIHYSYVGSNESIQKSEKDLTIVSASIASGSTVEVLVQELIGNGVIVSTNS